MKKVYPRKCVNCKERFKPQQNTQICCSPWCAVEYVRNKKTKEKQELEKAFEERKEKKGIKGALEVTKTVVHAYVRERDKGKNCISCGTPWNNFFQAGHYYPAGSFETLKFNLDNIHGQCEQCNLYNSGNFENYTLKLPNRIGKERFEELTRLASIDKQFSKVWNLDNLKEIREEIKKLKKVL